MTDALKDIDKDTETETLRKLILAYYQDEALVAATERAWFFYHLGICTARRLTDCIEVIRQRLLETHGVPLTATQFAADFAERPPISELTQAQITRIEQQLKGKPPRSPLLLWREASKMTQAKLAARLHISKGYVSRIERGRSKPSFAMLAKIFKLTGITAAQIFKLTDIAAAQIAAIEGKDTVQEAAAAVAATLAPPEKEP